MAWLQNLAGKAENLLNKIDQNAANVLNETNTKNQIIRFVYYFILLSPLSNLSLC